MHLGSRQRAIQKRCMMRKIVLLMVLLAAPAYALDVQLTFEWDPNPEPFLGGYRLYWAETSGGPYTLAKSVGKVTTTTFDIDIYPGETFYFVLTAFGDSTCPAPCESGYSNEVFFSLPPDHPGGWVIKAPALRLKEWK